jgi:hypothetical protein
MQGRMAGVNIIQDGELPAVVSKLKLEVVTAFVLMEMNHYTLLMEFPFKRVHRKCNINGITKPSQPAQQY